MRESKNAVYPDLKGKCAIVTGGALGIGGATVAALASQGVSVTFFDRNNEAGEALKVRLQNEKTWFRSVDVSDLGNLQNEVVKAAEEMGGLHILVNNVGDYRRHQLSDVDVERWHQSLTLNLDHAFFASKAALPWLSQQGGSVINVGSIHGSRKTGGMIGYVTSKSGMSGLSRGLAREFGGANIRVNTVNPGMIDTEGNQEFMPEGTVRNVLERQCLKSVIVADDVADLVVFLSSDASKTITGQDIHIDAGL